MFVMNWASTYCQRASWILYVDDDTVVNLRNAMNFVTKTGNETRNSINCGTNIKAPVIRDPNYKWYLSPESYNQTHYPPYCIGLGYFITPETAARIYSTAK